jgi:hypothetical protein
MSNYLEPVRSLLGAMLDLPWEPPSALARCWCHLVGPVISPVCVWRRGVACAKNHHRDV